MTDETTAAVIGVGRVGLPLALFLESQGFRVVGIDIDRLLLERLARKEMPFREQGCQELLSRSRITFTDRYAAAAEADHIVITVGTPLRSHIETDLSLVHEVIRGLLPLLRPGQTIILRSTVAPETTAYLKQYIELHGPLRVGTDLGLAFCPERVAENNVLRELQLLPQIIGAEDEFSRERATLLFRPFGVRLMYTNYVSAELVKLFNNVSRYIDFAVANQFAIIANEYGQNIYELIRMANEDYPRGFIHSPGLTAGACLRKDFGMISERMSAPDLVLAAWKVNEYMPFHLVENISRYTPLYGKRVAVLGYTFKRNSDDERDTLVPKLIRYLERKVPRSIAICEPHLGDTMLDGHPNLPLEECVTGADVIFIAMNHDCFADARTIVSLAKDGAWIVDLWNCLKQNEWLIHVRK